MLVSIVIIFLFISVHQANSGSSRMTKRHVISEPNSDCRLAKTVLLSHPCKVGLVGCLPPQILRELCWEKAANIE